MGALLAFLHAFVLQLMLHLHLHLVLCEVFERAKCLLFLLQSDL